jgi:peptidyl-prolyl cis-trans isomerase B (cyclophilin B)
VVVNPPTGCLHRVRAEEARAAGPHRTSRAGRPPAVRQPVGRGGRYAQPEKSSFRQSVDRALPPFSAQRYVVIWLLGMIPLILVILLIVQLGNKSSPSGTAAAQATTTAQAAAGYAGGATAAPQPATGQNTSAPAPAEALSGPGKYMTIDTVKGKIVCKLYTDAAAGVSKTVANFETKANSGYFNGLLFHRVEDWVIQGGDPLTKDPSSISSGAAGTGGGNMPSEYNQIDFKAGALGVARGQDPAINNDSQFFIVKTDSSFLDGQYTNWGQVVQGMDVVTKIAIGDKINSIKVEDLQDAPKS